MKSTGKKLLTDIKADRNREEALIKYQRLTAAAFDKYSTVKLSMNLFTMYERMMDLIDEATDVSDSIKDERMTRREELEGYIDVINMALRAVYVDKTGIEQSLIDDITEIRNHITEEMKTLTFFVDAYEIYEYILNRKEHAVKGTVKEQLDTDQLAENMFDFVFSEDDKMLINTRIQEFIAQLPVRMTRSHFFDVISNSLMIYRGGEKKAVDDFILSIRDAALLDEPKGMKEYKMLEDLYKELSETDYSQLDEDTLTSLMDKINKAAVYIQEICSDYMMLTEIINDVLIVLYTDTFADKAYLDDKYATSCKIISEIVTATDIYEASASFDEMFVSLEGVQEDTYEILSFLDSSIEELSATYYEMYDSQSIKDNFDDLFRADRLTSTSLFMDINDTGVTVVVDEADDAYIMTEKDILVEDMKERFGRIGKLERRSVMAKVLALMPVFFNTKQEIKDYFQYALSSCTDMSELTACDEIINDMIMYDSNK